MRVSKRQRFSGYLPEELLPEILSKSSVKSLLRFRCVSISWLNCIDDPKFARLHLTRYNNGDAESYLSKQFGKILYSGLENVLRCGKTLTTTARLPSTTVHFVFDGLIMLSIGETDEVMLWNPSIRKTRRIPKCPEIQKGEFVVKFGIGFSSAINDYKYVIMHRTRTNYLEFFAVYTLSTNSWKIFEFQINGCRPSSYMFFQGVGSNPVCVGGYMYAISWCTNPNVLSFDLDNDRFGSVSLPDDYDYRFDLDNDRKPLLTLGDRGRSLALVQVCHVDGHIWIRQTTSWAKSFRFTFNLHSINRPYPPRVLHLNTKGELLLQFSKVLTLINLETKEEKTVPKTCQLVVRVWGYTESLLMLN